MKKPIHKIAFLFGLYVALHFVAACNLDCDCPTVKLPFFDYHALTIAANDPATQSVLNLDVGASEINFLSAAEPPCNHFNFITSAWSCDCDFNGSSGPKFPVTTLNIFANRAFDDLHPVDSSLTSLFTFMLHDPSSNLDYPIPAITFVQGVLRSLRFSTNSRPKQEEEPVVFTLQFIKSNNDTISVQTDTIRFH